MEEEAAAAAEAERLRLEEEAAAAEAERLRQEEAAAAEEAERLKAEAEAAAAQEAERLNTEEVKEADNEIKQKGKANTLSKNAKKRMKDKKNKLVKEVKAKLENNEEFTTDDVNDLASKWIEIADVDGSGTIDHDELSELVKKLDEGFDQDKLKEIFDAQDEEQNGELGNEKFGQALYECIKLMQNDE